MPRLSIGPPAASRLTSLLRGGERDLAGLTGGTSVMPLYLCLPAMRLCGGRHHYDGIGSRLDRLHIANSSQIGLIRSD